MVANNNRLSSKRLNIWQALSISDFAFILLILAVLISAIIVVYSKHLTRTYFAELQQEVKRSDNLKVEWGQLLLEQGAWGSQIRIEKIAHGKLDMEMPTREKVVVLKP